MEFRVLFRVAPLQENIENKYNVLIITIFADMYVEKIPSFADMK